MPTPAADPNPMARFWPKVRIAGVLALAEKFGVNESTVKNVVYGRNWTHVQ